MYTLGTKYTFRTFKPISSKTGSAAIDFGPSNELSTSFILSQAFLVRREGRQGPLGEKVPNLAF